MMTKAQLTIKGLALVALSSWAFAATPVEQRNVNGDRYSQYSQPQQDYSNQNYNAYGAQPSDNYNSQGGYAQQDNNDYSGQAGSTGDPMWDMINQIERLQSEVLELRGLVDQQSYEIKQLQKQQKQHYVDLDQRIEALSGGGSNYSSNASSNKSSAAPTPAPAKSASMSDDEIKATYQQALRSIKDRSYSNAASDLKRILNEGGNSFYVPFAHYWLAEVMLAQKSPDMQQAQQHFEMVVNNYSGHSKVAPSMYKLGTIYNVQGDKQKARDILKKLIGEFPGTSEANMASHYLDQIR